MHICNSLDNPACKLKHSCRHAWPHKHGPGCDLGVCGQPGHRHIENVCCISPNKSLDLTLKSQRRSA